MVCIVHAQPISIWPCHSLVPSSHVSLATTVLEEQEDDAGLQVGWSGVWTFCFLGFFYASDFHFVLKKASFGILLLFVFVVLFLFIFLFGLFFWCRRDETRFHCTLLVDFKHRPG